LATNSLTSIGSMAILPHSRSFFGSRSKSHD